MKAVSHWFYESDGYFGRRTHYLWRWNDYSPEGIDRRDFPSKAAALHFRELYNRKIERGRDRSVWKSGARAHRRALLREGVSA